MRWLFFVYTFFMIILANSHAHAITAPTNVSVSNKGAMTIGSTTIYSSTELDVSWTPPSGSSVDHYMVTATEGIGNTTLRKESTGTGITLNGLKSATSYSVSVKACADASCLESASSNSVTGTTFSENWQLQGTGSSVNGLTKIVSDANARISATRIGSDSGGDSASRILLYYGPMMTEGGTPKLTVASTSAVTDATVSLSYLSFQSYASSSGLFTPATASTLVKQVATGQGVPLSSDLGGKIRLFFEAEGNDGKTRIMYVDSKDGYTGRDFNSGTSGTCSSSSDYQSGGGCTPTVAIGVAGDTVNPNTGIANARQFKLGFPILDDWRWNGSSGTFMVFTTDKVPGCSDYNMNHGYAVWDGSTWKVQYDQGGCPKLFKSAQAAFPMHIGGQKYKMYYGDPSITTGRLSSSMPFLGPKKLIYADGSNSGSEGTVDFEDWENQVSARDVVFLWPDGQKLDAGAEGYIDDYHFLAPTGSLNLQVMYMAISNGTDVPIGAAAVLLNPGTAPSETPPTPVIKANGSSGNVSVDTEIPVSVSVNLDKGTMSGQAADWWLVVSTSSGTYSYVPGSGWVPGLKVAYQGSIFGINVALEILNSKLSEGDYTFYFGVDLTPNAIVDVSSLYYSMVSVQVKKASSDASRGVSLTRGSSVKLADSAIFPGIVHDGANIVVSYAKQNDLYAVNCDNNLNQTSTPRRITSTGNVTDHKHIFFSELSLSPLLNHWRC